MGALTFLLRIRSSKFLTTIGKILPKLFIKKIEYTYSFGTEDVPSFILRIYTTLSFRSKGVGKLGSTHCTLTRYPKDLISKRSGILLPLYVHRTLIIIIVEINFVRIAVVKKPPECELEEAMELSVVQKFTV